MILQEQDLGNGSTYQVRYVLYLPTDMDNAAFIHDPKPFMEATGWVRMEPDHYLRTNQMDAPKFRTRKGDVQEITDCRLTSSDANFMVTGVDNIGVVVAGVDGYDRENKIWGGNYDGLDTDVRIEYKGLIVSGTSDDVDVVVDSFGLDPMPTGKQFWEYSAEEYHQMMANLSQAAENERLRRLGS